MPRLRNLIGIIPQEIDITAGFHLHAPYYCVHMCNKYRRIIVFHIFLESSRGTVRHILISFSRKFLIRLREFSRNVFIEPAVIERESNVSMNHSYVCVKISLLFRLKSGIVNLARSIARSRLIYLLTLGISWHT